MTVIKRNFATVILFLTAAICPTVLPSVAAAQEAPEFSKSSNLQVDNRVELLRQKAVAGDVISQHKLGYMYSDGSGVAQNYTEAAKWLLKAANQGHVDSQVRLGWLYESGKGVSRDDAAAFYWFQKAAEQGEDVAQMRLSALYDSGRGVKQDRGEAIKWLRKAAENGLYVAQFQLGTLYASGEGGVPQDYAEAYFWITLSLASGEKNVYPELRRQVATHLKPEQIEEAKRKAAEWRKIHSTIVDVRPK